MCISFNEDHKIEMNQQNDVATKGTDAVLGPLAKLQWPNYYHAKSLFWIFVQLFFPSFLWVFLN